MGVLNGQPVSQEITNPAFINKNIDDIMPNQLGLNRPMSGTSIADIQATANKLYDATGASESTTGTVYSAPASTITDGISHEAALSALAYKFDPSSGGIGHRHTGAPGDGPMIAAVGSIHAFGYPPVTGDVVLVPGLNMTLTQVGNNITFDNAASGGGGGTGQGGINYILNWNAETDTLGWSTYQNTAQTTPVDGTGGTPSVTFSRSTLNPLRGNASFLFSKDAVDRQGEGVSYDFTIDSADLAAQLSISFDYHVESPFVPSSGEASSLSDIGVFIYDVTNGILIPVTPYNITTLGPNNFAFQAQFQASPDSLDYRLIFHVASTNASAYDFKLDNVIVGPVTAYTSPGAVAGQAALAVGVSLGDNVLAVVPFDTLGFDNTASWTLGSNAEYIAPVSGDYQVNGAVEFAASVAGQRSISIFVNGVEVTSLANDPNPDAVFTSRVAGSAVVKVNAGDSIQLFAYQNTGGLLLIGGGGVLYTHMSIALLESPVNAYSSNVIAAAVGLTATPSVPDTTVTLVPFDTRFYDTTNSFDISGSPGDFIVPESGFYDIEALLLFATSSAGSRTLYIYQNGSPLIALDSQGNPSGTLACLCSGATTIRATAGDLIQIFAQQTSGGSLTIGGSGPTFNHVSIVKKDSPSALSTPALVACSYGIGSPSLSIPDVTDRIITYRDVIYDTTSSYNGSTGTFLAPVSGVYDLKAVIEFTGPVVNYDHRLNVFINGTIFRTLRIENELLVNIIGASTDVKVNAGDTIEFYAYQNSGGTQTLGSSGNQYSYMSITKR